MDPLPNDLVFEIAKQLPLSDVVALGATSKELHRISNQVIRNRAYTRNSIDELSYFLFHWIKRDKYTSCGVMDNIIFNYTSIAYTNDPDTWRTYESESSVDMPSVWWTTLRNTAQEEQDLDILAILIVDPPKDGGINQWQFNFYMEWDTFHEDDPTEFYRITTFRERKMGALSLLASWYMYIEKVLRGPRLRSFHKKQWLPTQLPSIRSYMKAAYPAFKAFLTNEKTPGQANVVPPTPP